MVNKIALVISVIALASVGVFTFTQKTTNNRSIDQVQRAAVTACIGTNVNRALANESNLQTYKGLKDSIEFNKSQETSQVAAIEALGFNQEVLNKAVSESKRQINNQKARLRALFWIQLSDCNQPGRSTQSPAYFAFDHKLPAPSQLSVTNAILVTPKGSRILHASS